VLREVKSPTHSVADLNLNADGPDSKAHSHNLYVVAAACANDGHLHEVGVYTNVF
jgi:hypothetical protein